MKSSGIRIADLKGNVCISLLDLLPLLNKEDLNWALLWLRAQPKLEHVESVVKLSRETNDSPNGLICSWDFLLEMAKKLYQEFDLLIIGSKSIQNLHRYNDDQEMYETCDVVIEMIDGGFWEIFSSDSHLIDKLKTQFHETKLLDVDFQKKEHS